MCGIILAANEMMRELQLRIGIQTPMAEGDDSVRQAAMALANYILLAQHATSVVQLSPIHLLQQPQRRHHVQTPHTTLVLIKPYYVHGHQKRAICPGELE